MAQSACLVDYAKKNPQLVIPHNTTAPHKASPTQLPDLVPPPLPHSKHIIGDVNDDGHLTYADIQALENLIAGRGNIRHINVAGPAHAQTNIVIGDLNNDGLLTVADIVALIETIKGHRAMQRIARDGSTFRQDENGYAFVDLGLPSGTLWATCNIGAERPEEAGDLYEWAQIVPGKIPVLSTEYYARKEKYGTTNNFIPELEVSDDVAYVRLGPNWRIPSMEQYKELLNGCNLQWITYNGVQGVIFTSKINGNSIFLPETHKNFGTVEYWTRSHKDVVSSYNFWMRENVLRLNYETPMYVAFSIRPVHVPSAELEEHKYVDLCLPSGTLWAATNIGANSPEQSGDYIAWGEVAPKSTYNWNNYRYCNGTYNSLTKYCDDSNYGTVDNKEELDYEDDAAYYNWGPDWCLPSDAQQVELIVYCNGTLSQQNGVEGCKYTSPINGNSIFIPFSGLAEGTKIRDVGNAAILPDRGFYQNATSSLHIFIKGKYLPNRTYRSYGQTMRPVRVQNKHEYVDLGLTSGTLWASTNIGAQNPEDAGDYFAWGEVKVKDIYDSNTYKYTLNIDKDTRKSTYSKYCVKEVDGIVDYKTQLDSDDDAAYVNWGPDWCMPTKDQLYELINECTWTKTYRNGIYGYIIQSKKNGNSIFLPFAGSREDNELDWLGKDFYYPSRDLCDDYSHCIEGIMASSDSPIKWTISRTIGLPIRPVRAATLYTESIEVTPSLIPTFIGNTHQLTAIVTPANAANKTLTWTSSSPSIVSVSNDGLVTAHNNGRATITVSNGNVSATCVIKVSTEFEFMIPPKKEDPDPIPQPIPDDPNHDYVDLGLPSGTLWATCNIGASSPYDNGDYFSWGEIQPKESYSQSFYKYGGEELNTVTKYCTNPRYGNIDGLTNLLPTDDAAIQNWGELWVMPTVEQAQELIDNCSWFKMGQHSAGQTKYYYKIIGPNGNVLILPISGMYLYGSTCYYVGEKGRYWLRSVDTYYCYTASSLSIDNNAEKKIECRSSYREYGHSVRPVRSLSIPVRIN